MISCKNTEAGYEISFLILVLHDDFYIPYFLKSLNYTTIKVGEIVTRLNVQ